MPTLCTGNRQKGIYVLKWYKIYTRVLTSEILHSEHWHWRFQLNERRFCFRISRSYFRMPFLFQNLSFQFRNAVPVSELCVLISECRFCFRILRFSFRMPFLFRNCVERSVPPYRRTSTSCAQWSSTFRTKWWRRRPMHHVPNAYWKSVLTAAVWVDFFSCWVYILCWLYTLWIIIALLSFTVIIAEVRRKLYKHFAWKEATY